MNTTHTVRFELPPSRVARFCVGLAILYAVWACKATIARYVFSCCSPGLESYGSVTGVVLPLLIEFVIMIGSIAIFIGTIGWRTVVDIVGGVVMTVRAWRARSVAVQQAAAAATEGAQYAASNAAGAQVAVATSSAAMNAATASLAQTPLQQLEDKVSSAFRKRDEQFTKLSAQVEQVLDAVQGLKESQEKPATTAKSTRGRKVSNE